MEETTDSITSADPLTLLRGLCENIMQRLARVEAQQAELLLVRKDVLTLEEVLAYTRLSESHLYKLTAKRKIPHYKQGKLLYFIREEIDRWRTAFKVKTKEELEAEAISRIRKMKS